MVYAEQYRMNHVGVPLQQPACCCHEAHEALGGGSFLPGKEARHSHLGGKGLVLERPRMVTGPQNGAFRCAGDAVSIARR